MLSKHNFELKEIDYANLKYVIPKSCLLLFLLYINNLSRNSRNETICLFMNDTTLFRKKRKRKPCTRFQSKN